MPLTWWVSVDHLNRPVKMTNASKASVWDATWQPWGGVHSITGTGAFNLRFPGQWFQLETGLHYNWHRSYDPSLGRYTQPDPLGFVDGPSVYGYARGNPGRFVDPVGTAIGDLPPAPPGYTPKWPSGQYPNGRYWILDPETGTRYICHPEDKTHWRHWDKQGPGGDDQGRWPKDSKKPWESQNRAPYDGQSAVDPSGNAQPWEPQFVIDDTTTLSPFSRPMVPQYTPAPNAPTYRFSPQLAPSFRFVFP